MSEFFNRPHAQFPHLRPRRLRQSAHIRDLVAENRLNVSDLVWPIFVHDQKTPRLAVSSLPGIDRLNIDEAIKAAKEASDLGIKLIALFPHISNSLRTKDGTAALDENGLIPTVCRAIKASVPDIGIMVDIALDPYTDHGHDGIFDGEKILNDATTEMLCAQACLSAKAGADVVAPSDMMDGRIGMIRQSLEKASFQDTLIMSYAAKYASSFYGPYRDAIGVNALKGDKKTYQMDPANSDEALLEVMLDLEEGADMVMVKPGLAYLDIVYRVAKGLGAPTFVYQVSGEYAMIKAASQAGVLDEKKCVLESLMAFKRAGARGILSYYARDVAIWLQEKNR